MYLARFIYINWGHNFYVSWRGDRHFTWSSESCEGLAACSGKRVSIGPAPGMEPVSSRSVVKRFTD